MKLFQLTQLTPAQARERGRLLADALVKWLGLLARQSGEFLLLCLLLPFYLSGWLVGLARRFVIAVKFSIQNGYKDGRG